MKPPSAGEDSALVEDQIFQQFKLLEGQIDLLLHHMDRTAVKMMPRRK